MCRSFFDVVILKYHEHTDVLMKKVLTLTKMLISVLWKLEVTRRRDSCYYSCTYTSYSFITQIG